MRPPMLAHPDAPAQRPKRTSPTPRPYEAVQVGQVWESARRPARYEIAEVHGRHVTGQWIVLRQQGTGRISRTSYASFRRGYRLIVGP